MAFKRYIRRHGKKLGPYYYENVRSNDGRVKSVYLGTNPHHHPKHRIRKPLFFLILVLMLILILGGSLFLLQNRSYLIKKVSAHEPDFEIDQILLKVLIRSGEFIEKQVRIMNTGNDPSGIDVAASGLSDIVKIDSPSFIIKPGQTKVVALNFSSVVPEQSIEQQPGIYVGKLIAKSEKAAKEVPVVVEIETKNVLFDMNLNPVGIERRVKQGSDTTIEVRLFNLESIDSVNVDVEYFVKDMNGNTIITESETVVVKTQASFFKTISIPKNLKPGSYVFAAIAGFGNSMGTSSYLFEVIGPEAESSFVQFCKSSILCLGLSLTTMLLLFALIAYFYFFIGAYLYEKVTGVVTIPGKSKEKVEVREAEEKGPGIFGRVSGKIRQWRRKREEEKAEKEELARKEELESLAEENAPIPERKKRIEEEKLEEELESRQEERQREKLEREKAAKKRIELLKALLHSAGLFKTPEEKKQIAIQKEKAAREKLKEYERLKRQKELERLKSLEEKKRLELEEQKEKQLEEENRRREEQKLKEQLERQKDLERLKSLEEKKRLEESRKARLDQEKKQAEAEKQRKQLEKSQKFAAIRQLEESLAKNKELSGQLRKELRGIESEKRELSSVNNDADARIKKLEHDIIEKSRRNEELSLQKKLMFENFQKRLNEIAQQQQGKKAAKEERVRELKAKLAAKQESVMKELENELSKLSVEKRKATEKWKRLEVKAKLKIEEQNIEDHVKEEETSDGRKSIDDNYKKSVEELGKKQNDIKGEIAVLERQKRQVLLEKRNVPGGLAVKENELQKILSKLDANAKEKDALSAELSKLRSELSKFSIHFIKSLVSEYREKAEKAREAKEKERARLEAEKKREEGIAKKEKEIAEKAKRLEEERKRREDEKRAKEEQRRRALEDKINLKEERKKQKEAEWQEPSEEKPGEAEEGPKQEAEAERNGLFRFFRRKAKPEFEVGKTEVAAKKKAGLFAGLFGEREENHQEKAEGLFSEEPSNKPISEAEELEEAIRGLDLFKKVEKGRSIGEKSEVLKRVFKKEAEEAKPEAKKAVFGKLLEKTRKMKENAAENMAKRPKLFKSYKSKNLEKFRRILENAESGLAKNDLAKAKRLYLEAREFYIRLEYGEKKEVYGDLTELYNKLSK